jgi:hypothetical protein
MPSCEIKKITAVRQEYYLESVQILESSTSSEILAADTFQPEGYTASLKESARRTFPESIGNPSFVKRPVRSSILSTFVVVGSLGLGWVFEDKERFLLTELDWYREV